MTDREKINRLRWRIGSVCEQPGDLSQLAALEHKVASAADMPQGQCSPPMVTGSAWSKKKSAPVDDD